MAIRVLVHGGLGRMGSQSVQAVAAEEGLDLGGIVDKLPQETNILDGVPYFTDVGKAIEKSAAQVMIDFSLATAAVSAIEIALKNGVHVVSGTTGIASEDIERLGIIAEKNNVCFMTAANFAIGAVLMLSFAQTAAKYLDHAEIIEMHHDKKQDAPSGTAITTAKVMSQERPQGFIRPSDNSFKSRGEDFNGIAVHAVRLPGYLARQEVHFGATGQTLTITHNTITRDCFMPGVILSVKEVMKHTGLIKGLEVILNL
ncbi:MAG: 4-hydroxy-tetrahydrodipicolinate reductase [Chloroflexi bacterium]|nr:4-hydroxy-tetrahydrodipicolinate reductase [Chloroflexota bacterium]